MIGLYSGFIKYCPLARENNLGAYNKIGYPHFKNNVGNNILGEFFPIFRDCESYVRIIPDRSNCEKMATLLGEPLPNFQKFIDFTLC